MSVRRMFGSRFPLANLLIVTALFALNMANSSHAANLMNMADALFVPSFRGQPNTTWFGSGPLTPWGNQHAFDGDPDDEFLDNPAPNINFAPGAALEQNNASAILAISNSIYYPFPDSSTALDLTLTIPTVVPADQIGSGFTTIIIQGRGTSTAGLTKTLVFGEIVGTSPTFVFGRNQLDQSGQPVAVASGLTQRWAKYQIPGSPLGYSVDVSAQSGAARMSPVSVGELVINTPSGQAPDTHPTQR